MHTKRGMGNMTYDIGDPGFGFGQGQQCLSIVIKLYLSQIEYHSKEIC